jgi:hypothetical protein
MTTRSIVKRVDVITDIGERQFTILVDLLLDALFLQAAEEGLRDGIVPTVALATHARLEPIGSTEPSPRVATVLSSLIRVDHRLTGPSTPHGHQHSVEHQLALNARTC